MKRILFSAGIVALATSCSQELETLSMQELQTKGITFEATDGASTNSRGHFEENEDGSYAPFWWAEQDQIKVFAKNVNKGESPINEWSDEDAGYATYKATKSERKGQFTSVDANNLLTFNGTATGEFLAVYPSGLTATLSSNTFTFSNLPALYAQTQKTLTGQGVYENMVKYSYTTAKKENDYDAVGEKVDLDFQRVLSGLVFKTKNSDKYTTGTNSVFGNLKTVKAKLVGPLNEDGEGYDNTKALNLGYKSNASFTVTVPTTAGGAVSATDVTVTNPTSVGVKEITTTLSSANGLAWNEDASVFMVTLPLQMADKNVAKQNLEVTYEFANIEFTVTHELTKKDWENGKFYQIPALDINSYDYLLTNGSNGDRTLIVNKGNFSDIFNTDGEIKWNTDVAKSTVGTIIVGENVKMTEADLKGLKDFTNLTSLEIAGVTSIPADALKDLSAKITSINLPNVTSIDEKFTDENFSVLRELYLPAYSFENEKVNEKFFTSTSTTIQKLDISGVASMTPVFGLERTLSFANYTALTEVTVQDNVKLSANAFNGCTNLAKVNGIVDLANGTAAFKGCAALVKVNINSTVIPSEAFYGCTALTNVIYNGKQVAPTKVGSSAFYGVKGTNSKFYMNLSNAQEIGASAFELSNLTSNDAATDVLTVGVANVANASFKSIPVKMIHFTNATGVEDSILEGNIGTLKQIKFSKPFVYTGISNTPAQYTFPQPGEGSSSDIILFVSSEQTGWTGTTLTLKGKTGTTNYTFKSITVED